MLIAFAIGAIGLFTATVWVLSAALGLRRTASIGVAAQPVRRQLLARGQGDRTIDLEGAALSADDHVGAAAAVEVLGDPGGEFVGNSRSQSLADIDMLAGDLDLHGMTTRRPREGVKPPPTPPRRGGTW